MKRSYSYFIVKPDGIRYLDEILNDLEGKPRAITLKVPEGIQNGEKIRLIGQGRQEKTIS